LGWGRGVGWYALGLVDTLAALPLASAHRPRLIESATNLRQSVLRFQRPDGGWGALLTVSGSEYDSSATALLGYFLLRTSSLGLAPVATPVPSVQRAIASLRARTRANGQVDFSQGSCIGLDRMSQRYAPTPYTQGMAIAVFSLNTNTGIGA
jgi:unsaturated rhamnogalacturonyl hydrolase